MQKICSENQKEALHKILLKDTINCFYIYMNLLKYGYANSNVDFFINREKDPTFVLMRYYNSCQLFGNPNKEDIKKTLDLIIKINPTIITGTKPTVDTFFNYLSDIYDISYGYTFELTSFPTFKFPCIDIPSDEELYDCAKLIQSDRTIGSYYQVDSLYEQLVNRRAAGFGRNYIIKNDDQIIGHIATYAENEEFASTAGLIVKEGYRNLPYGTFLESYLVNELLSEGKRVVSFLREERRLKYYKKLSVGTFNINGKLQLKAEV